MSDEIDATSEVARVLGEHPGWRFRAEEPGDWYVCSGCGTELETLRSAFPQEFYDHQAAMLAEAGLLRDEATIDALNERCRILVDEGDAFRHDLTNLREGLMERVGRYTPNDADLLAYVDGLRAQIATQEPAGATLGGSGDSRASGGLGERLRALVSAIYADDGYFGVTALEIRGLADEADRMERDREGLRLRAELAESGLAMAARQKRAEREGS